VSRRTYLDDILTAHRQRAADDPRDADELRRALTSVAPTRGFAARLRRDSAEGLAVISEIKRRSPSKGALNADLDPADMARRYVSGGASCLSVLTDDRHFGGSIADLRAARAAVEVPVLRKDFTVDARDVIDARSMGADCVLLIAAALTPDELISFHRLAVDIGIDALVEIHDEDELDVALAAGASLIGVNQRDLVTFEVDHQRAERMASRIPDHVVKVAESGVRGPDDARRLKAAGYHAVLVGESVVTAGDPAAAVRRLRSV
jgi:indole-3-glycerol phosphate synthase